MASSPRQRRGLLAVRADDAVGRIRGLGDRAVDVIGEALDQGATRTGLRAAERVLDHLGVSR